MPDLSANPQLEPLTRPQRLIAGILLLILVDVIWVASSEFTEYIFKDLHYDKPYFSTYFKTCLFTSYLMGFVVYAPWRQEAASRSSNSVNGHYHRVQDSSEDETGVLAGDEDEAMSFFRRLGSPSLVPANIPESGKSSGTEESDGDGAAVSLKRPRRVRFKQVAEVVEMNPGEAVAANLARLSYSASLRAQAALRRAAQRLTVFEVSRLALVFCLPWFLGNYCYQVALSNTEAAVVNILSSTSGLFTLLLSSLFPSESSDRFTLSKFCAVLFSICGVITVSYSDLQIEGGVVIPKGALWALGGALFYSTYIVLLRRKVTNEENMDAPMFFGFVGMFSAVLLWPGLLLCHFTGTETFELPTVKQWEMLIVNGLIGTVLSELLWLWGCFYTSSLLATLAIGLNIPLSVLADVMWRQKKYDLFFIIGTLPMFFSFFLITMLTHYEDWDPLLDGCKLLWHKIRLLLCCQPRRANSYVFDRQERESLINQETNPSQDAIL